ncbi:hypothetical protein [Roseibium sp. SCP14]|uniref:hypothetical protein n=1 Tax=Roseibium sp. SCP14 TaxID=3141375 RepID=UPI00333C8A23
MHFFLQVLDLGFINKQKEAVGLKRLKRALDLRGHGFGSGVQKCPESRLLSLAQSVEPEQARRHPDWQTIVAFGAHAFCNQLSRRNNGRREGQDSVNHDRLGQVCVPEDNFQIFIGRADHGRYAFEFSGATLHLKPPTG